ncbi:metallophosphoesterase [Bacillus paranthracis]|uniref:metallophosphoesterase n=1 Tax=Bacillus paranthracis TaxID=2026186 RepID=UPI002FDC0AB7|nr:serine/threonine protein phosphatase [Bacillus paranthracis]
MKDLKVMKTTEEEKELDSFFVVGDIHGCLLEFTTMLKKWDRNAYKLIQLGDLLDRGKHSKSTLILAMYLKKQYGAIFLKGNHEELFLNFIDDPVNEGEFYLNQGGNATIDSFLGEKASIKYIPEHLANLIKEKYPEVIQFIRDMPYFHESEFFIFVHAGVNLVYSNWKNSSESDFVWIRQPFHYGMNETGKTIVFGHTITRVLNEDKSNDIWISPCKTKIGIDGGAVFDGQLNGLVIDGNTYKTISV